MRKKGGCGKEEAGHNFLVDHGISWYLQILLCLPVHATRHCHRPVDWQAIQKASLEALIAIRRGDIDGLRDVIAGNPFFRPVGRLGHSLDTHLAGNVDAEADQHLLAKAVILSEPARARVCTCVRVCVLFASTSLLKENDGSCSLSTVARCLTKPDWAILAGPSLCLATLLPHPTVADYSDASAPLAATGLYADSPAAIKMLLLAGADDSSIDSVGRSPLEIALILGHVDCAEIIVST